MIDFSDKDIAELLRKYDVMAYNLSVVSGQKNFEDHFEWFINDIEEELAQKGEW